MKRSSILVLAVFLAWGWAAPAFAIDFTIRGAWQFSFDYINGGSFMGKTRSGHQTIGQQWAAVRQQRDNFEAMQRLHLQLNAKASDYLSGTLFLEIGEQRWGQASSGGALGADSSSIIKVKQAYLDWGLPDTALKVRMGIQGASLPGFAMESNVLVDDVAGITASYGISKNVAVTGFWYRLLNDNYVDKTVPGRDGYMDNFDLFGLIVPLSFDGLKLTPWGMAGGLGPNSIDFKFRKMADGSGGEQFYLGQNPNPNQGIDGQQLRDGLYPAAFTTGRSKNILSDEYSTLWWGGLTGKWTTLEPFRLSFDFTYGSVDHNREYLNRHGWFGMLLAEYAMDWGLPGLYGWYMSGDDDNPHNGSERMPYLSTTNSWRNTLSTFGFRGNPIIGGGKGEINVNPTGTWGAGVRIRDFKPWDISSLSHTLVFNVFGGTNSPKMANYITGRHGDKVDGGRNLFRNNTDFNSFGTYLTTADSGMEVNIDTRWKPDDNLTFYLNTGYIHLWLNDDVWGRYGDQKGKTLNYKDAWEASLNIVYSF
ncbi:MAG: outer membrane homotrimeric porin [Desulfovibrio sp.]|nr:outer membrane homotrimeric porin [Desulfovibrio sp.]